MEADLNAHSHLEDDFDQTMGVDQREEEEVVEGVSDLQVDDGSSPSSTSEAECKRAGLSPHIDSTNPCSLQMTIVLHRCSGT